MSVITTVLSDFFERHPFTKGETIGVAVSGGADSLCLTLCLADYASKNGMTLLAATVDHRLRPESTDEANQVHDYLKNIGIKHTILTWVGRKPTARIEEKAREKRYELLSKWCKQQGIRHLFLAHHAGDQSETFWARLGRGTGINGLSAISEYSPRDEIVLCRPFLALSKDVLIAYLHHRHITWAEDSMNADEAYERVRWRHRQRELDRWGLTSEVITRTTLRLQRARQALDFYADRFCSALVDIMPEGYACISQKAFSSIPEEIQLRVLERTLKCISSSKAIVSMDALERWLKHKPARATLFGCVMVVQNGLIFVAREVKRMEKPMDISPNTATYWDRFCILSSYSVRISAGTDDKKLPYPVRQAIPRIDATIPVRVSFLTGTQKELEKKFILDYKKEKSDIVCILFMKGKL